MSNAVNAPDSDRSNNVDDRSVTHTDPVVADDTTTLDRREVVGRQKDAFGGMKFGSCFFGWLTASGAAVLLIALVTGVGAALGLTQNVDVTNPTAAQTESIGFVGGIILVAIIFVSYLAGGYVAGLIAIAGWLADARFDVLAQLNSFPRIPLNEGTLTTAGVIAAVCVVAASLIGALLGGLAGMRYHRRVDRAGLGR
jgi:hypothetical protein